MSDDKPTPAELQQEIEATREDLAETIDELTARLDVKARVHDKIEDVKHEASEQLHRLGGTVSDKATDSRGRPIPAAVVVGGVLLVVAAVVLWRRRSH